MYKNLSCQIGAQQCHLGSGGSFQPKILKSASHCSSK
jgi:hypothetical protein